MQAMRFEAKFRTSHPGQDSYTYCESVSIQAQNVNAGFKQAARLALFGLPPDTEIESLTVRAVER